MKLTFTFLLIAFSIPVAAADLVDSIPARRILPVTGDVKTSPPAGEPATVRGSDNPLLVIDGILTEFDQLSRINPGDIASIDILKDSGRFFCGNHATVIIITTKSSSKQRIVIKDFLTDQAIPFASITVEAGNNVRSFTANEEGEAVIDRLKGAIVKVSSTGYVPYAEKLDGGMSKIRLQRDIRVCEEVTLRGIGHVVYHCLLFCVGSERQKPEAKPDRSNDGNLRVSSLFRMSVYPNPALRNSRIRIDFNSERALRVVIELYDLAGRRLFTGTRDLLEGQNSMTLATDPGWAEGIYLLQLRNEKGLPLKSEKVILQ